MINFYKILFVFCIITVSCSKKEDEVVTPNTSSVSISENRNFILAGETDQLTYVDINPNLRPVTSVPDSQGNYQGKDSLDLDGDGIFDIVFVIVGNNDLVSQSLPAYVQYHVKINNSMEISHESLNFIDTLNLNDTINSSLNWGGVSCCTEHLFYYSSPWTGYGLWNHLNSNKYLAFRKILPSDTIYGWVNLGYSTVPNSSGLYVDTYAIQN